MGRSSAWGAQAEGVGRRGGLGCVKVEAYQGRQTTGAQSRLVRAAAAGLLAGRSKHVNGLPARGLTTRAAAQPSRPHSVAVLLVKVAPSTKWMVQG